MEVEEEPDAIHRRLHSPQRSSLHGVHLGSHRDEALDSRMEVMNSQVNAARGRKKVQISARLGGVASRALAETLGTDVHLRRPFAGRPLNKRNEENSVNVKANIKRSTAGTLMTRNEGQNTANNRNLVERLGRSPSKKLSLLERLGSRQRKEPSPRSAGSSDEETGVDYSIANRIMAIRNLQDTGKVNSVPGSNESSSAGGVSRVKDANLGFTVKSLADIRAAKQKKDGFHTTQLSNNTGNRIQSRFGTKNGTKLTLEKEKAVEITSEVDSIRVMSLSELKAKQKSSLNNRSNVSFQRQKRPISPISFGGDKQKTLSNSDSSTTQKKKRSISPVSFGSETKLKSSQHNNTSLVHRKKRSVSPISFERDDGGSKKVCSLPQSRESVQTTEAKMPVLGRRKVTIVKSPLKQPINSKPDLKAQVKGATREKVVVNNFVNTRPSVKSMDNKNNNVSVEKTKTAVTLSRQQPSGETNTKKIELAYKPLNSTLSRLDSSILDDEEELLLGGEMADDEDEDIDEAALLL